MTAVGTVRELWRYPVKSMLGEKPWVLNIDQRGVVGDRSWAVYDSHGKLGSGKNSRRFRRMDGLFTFSAAYPHDETDVPLVTSPDGNVRSANDRHTCRGISDVLGLPVYLERGDATSHLDSSPVHLITTAALSRLQEFLPDVSVDERRFRPNLVLAVDDAAKRPETGRFVEDTWVGHELVIGKVRLALIKRTERCVMVNNAQSDLVYDRRVLRTVTRVNELCFGVYAEVLVPGIIRRGDVAELI